MITIKKLEKYYNMPVKKIIEKLHLEDKRSVADITKEAGIIQKDGYPYTQPLYKEIKRMGLKK